MSGNGKKLDRVVPTSSNVNSTPLFQPRHTFGNVSTSYIESDDVHLISRRARRFVTPTPTSQEEVLVTPSRQPATQQRSPVRLDPLTWGGLSQDIPAHVRAQVQALRKQQQKEAMQRQTAARYYDDESVATKPVSLAAATNVRTTTSNLSARAAKLVKQDSVVGQRTPEKIARAVQMTQESVERTLQSGKNPVSLRAMGQVDSLTQLHTAYKNVNSTTTPAAILQDPQSALADAALLAETLQKMTKGRTARMQADAAASTSVMMSQSLHTTPTTSATRRIPTQGQSSSVAQVPHTRRPSVSEKKVLTHPTIDSHSGRASGSIAPVFPSIVTSPTVAQTQQQEKPTLLERRKVLVSPVAISHTVSGRGTTTSTPVGVLTQHNVQQHSAAASNWTGLKFTNATHGSPSAEPTSTIHTSPKTSATHNSGPSANTERDAHKATLPTARGLSIETQRKVKARIGMHPGALLEQQRQRHAAAQQHHRQSSLDANMLEQRSSNANIAKLAGVTTSYRPQP